MKFVQSLEELHSHYSTPGDTALQKVASKMTPEYRAWISRSRFCVLSTVGPEGTDATPRGDDGPVVDELDDSTLAMPDWRGNNRIDSLRNIVRDPRSSLLFMMAGSKKRRSCQRTGTGQRRRPIASPVRARRPSATQRDRSEN